MAGEEEKLGQGTVRHGMEWYGKDSLRVGGGSANRQGIAGLGGARLGEAWHGKTR